MNPDQFTISETMLDVGNGHSLYVQDWGNKKAKTTFIFLHGGPGSGCSDSHKLYFNPDKNRVIFFDQRGSGQSLPYGELKHNKTKDLIGDINQIAKRFKLKEFVLVGGSWGSTLAMAYGLAEPKKVKAMVLRGLFTGSKREIDFLEKGSVKDFYPEVWQAFLNHTPKKYHSDPTSFHIPRLLGDNPQIIFTSAYAMSLLQLSVMSLDDRHSSYLIDEFDPVPTRIEVSYSSKLCHMPDNYILKNAHKLTMPTFLIQGRYDMICRPVIAYELHNKMPNSSLIWTLAGHSGRDRANFEATQTAIASFA